MKNLRMFWSKLDEKERFAVFFAVTILAHKSGLICKTDADHDLFNCIGYNFEKSSLDDLRPGVIQCLKMALEETELSFETAYKSLLDRI